MAANTNKYIYVTTSKIPTVYDAQAQRVLNICKSLEAASVLVISNCNRETNQVMVLGDTTITFTSYRTTESSTAFEKIKSRIMQNKRIRDVLFKTQYNYIIFNDLKVSTTKILKKYANKKEASLIYDAVEWYSPSEFLMRQFSYTLINNTLINSKLIDKSIKVISISKYFHEYYSGKKITSFYLPVIFDKNEYSFSDSENNLIEIVYAGHMGKKDNLTLFLDTLFKEPDDVRKHFHITLIGPKQTQLNYFENNSNIITFIDFMSHDKLIELYKKMDFSILFRNPNERYAKAGFPTKMVESMMCGIPLICNIFSNIGDYLIDGKNSLIVNYSESSISNCLERLANMSRNEVLEIKKNARNTAIDCFDYRKYSAELVKFIRRNDEET